jgi:hypothetical protein
MWVVFMIVSCEPRPVRIALIGKFIRLMKVLPAPCSRGERQASLSADVAAAPPGDEQLSVADGRVCGLQQLGRSAPEEHLPRRPARRHGRTLLSLSFSLVSPIVLSIFLSPSILLASFTLPTGVSRNGNSHEK